MLDFPAADKLNNGENASPSPMSVDAWLCIVARQPAFSYIDVYYVRRSTAAAYNLAREFDLLVNSPEREIDQGVDVARQDAAALLAHLDSRVVCRLDEARALRDAADDAAEPDLWPEWQLPHRAPDHLPAEYTMFMINFA